LAVTIEYMGRFGNNLFQYTFARLLAEKNRMNVETPWIHNDILPVATSRIPFFNEPEERGAVQVLDLSKKPWQRNEKALDGDYAGKDIVTKGFFQNPDYYDRDVVKPMFELGANASRNPRSVVIHLRLGDYFQPKLRTVIDPAWHCGCLKICGKVDDIHIVAQSPEEYEELDAPYKAESVGYIKNFPIKGQWHFPDLKGSFDLIRSFPTIISSNSTMCWWAAILSDAVKIYSFAPWYRQPQGRVIRLAFHRALTPVNGRWLD